LEQTRLSQIRLELKLAKTINWTKIRSSLTQIKATLIQVQFMPKCGFILISMRIAKIRATTSAR